MLKLPMEKLEVYEHLKNRGMSSVHVFIHIFIQMFMSFMKGSQRNKYSTA